VRTLFRVFALLPLPLLHALGAALGWLSFLASPTYRRRFLDNARQAGYGLREVSPAVAEAGKLISEVPRLWFGRAVRLEWDGATSRGRAPARARRSVLTHLGCLSLGPLRGAVQLSVLTGPPQALAARAGRYGTRARHATAPTTLAARQMMRALRRGEAVGLLPDQVPPEGLGTWAPFFGRAAYTMTLSTRLATQTGAAVLLAWAERLPWGRGYRLHFRSWPGEIARDAAGAAAQVNAQMERLIRECPQQYLWGYARYKQPRQDWRVGGTP
jgi:KDO2-lipid IV(A) lauroyltransferase